MGRGMVHHEASDRTKFSIALGSPNVGLDLSLFDDELEVSKSSIGSWLNSQPKPNKQAKVLLFSDRDLGPRM
eukprot:1826975-Rhodomonas_salina.1